MRLPLVPLKKLLYVKALSTMINGKERKEDFVQSQAKCPCVGILLVLSFHKVL